MPPEEKDQTKDLAKEPTKELAKDQDNKALKDLAAANARIEVLEAEKKTQQAENDAIVSELMAKLEDAEKKAVQADRKHGIVIIEHREVKYRVIVPQFKSPLDGKVIKAAELDGNTELIDAILSMGGNVLVKEVQNA